ncbi:MAG: hypothetical protein JWM27_959 [Gemmatimonadetes bacterium]|nr:hypothetical protein [Gemmatimonadota bacterium]
MTQDSGVHAYPGTPGTAKAMAAGMPRCVRPESAASRGAFGRLDSHRIVTDPPAPRGNGIRQPELGGMRSMAGWNEGRRNRAGCVERCAVGA